MDPEDGESSTSSPLGESVGRLRLTHDWVPSVSVVDNKHCRGTGSSAESNKVIRSCNWEHRSRTDWAVALLGNHVWLMCDVMFDT